MPDVSYYLDAKFSAALALYQQDMSERGFHFHAFLLRTSVASADSWKYRRAEGKCRGGVCTRGAV